MTEQGAAVAGEADVRLVCLGVLGADAMHVGTVLGDPLHLHCWRCGRHEHCRRDSELSGGVGVGQAGVPAGGDDDADRGVQLTAFPRGQLPVERTTGLEDTAVLEELTLQPDLWQRYRIAAEHGAATAYAAVHTERITDLSGLKTAVIVCGANTDPHTLEIE